MLKTASVEVNQLIKEHNMASVGTAEARKQRRLLSGESYSGLIEGPSSRLGSSRMCQGRIVFVL